MNDRLKEYFEQIAYYNMNYNKAITVLILVLGFWGIYEVNGIKSSIDKNTAELKLAKKYAISTNNRNQIKGFEKEKLTDEKYKFIIAGYLEKYLVKSAYDLASRSNKKEFSDYNEFFSAQNGTGGLKEFYYNFIYSPKNPESKSDEIVELETQGQTAFKSLIQKYFVHFRKKEFPLVKDSLGANLKDIDYNFNGNKFVISVKIQMVTAGVTPDGIAYKNLHQTAYFKASGYIDEDNSDPILNPLGIKFNAFTDVLPVLNPTTKAINALTINKKTNKTIPQQDGKGKY